MHQTITLRDAACIPDLRLELRQHARHDAAASPHGWLTKLSMSFPFSASFVLLQSSMRIEAYAAACHSPLEPSS